MVRADDILKKDDKHERVRGVGVGLRIKEKAAPFGEFAERQRIMIAEDLPCWMARQQEGSSGQRDLPLRRQSGGSVADFGR